MRTLREREYLGELTPKFLAKPNMMNRYLIVASCSCIAIVGAALHFVRAVRLDLKLAEGFSERDRLAKNLSELAAARRENDRLSRELDTLERQNRGCKFDNKHRDDR